MFKNGSRLKSGLMGVLPLMVATLMLFNGILNILIALFPAIIFHRHGIYVLKNEGLIAFFSNPQISTALSIIIGLLLISVAIGLYRRLRSALFWSVFLLLLLIANNAYPIIRPTPLIFGLLSLAVLILFRNRFLAKSKPGQLTALIAMISFIIAIAYGSIGSFLMRSQFEGIHTFVDAIYYTLVTYSTLGYGDIFPKTTDAKLFVITMILIGIGSFAAIATVLIQRHIKRVLNMVEKLKHYRNHTIICGVNNLMMQIAQDLKTQGCDIVFVDTNVNQLALAKQLGYDALLGDAMNSDMLKQARIDEASFIICGFDSDAENILVAMTAKRLINANQNNTKAKIITKIDHSNNIQNAIDSGSDETIVPAILTSQKILTILNKNL